MAEHVLLDPADAVVDVERFRGEQDGAHVVIRQDPFGLHRALGRDHPVQGRLRPHDPGCAAVGKIVFDEVGEFVVQEFGLRFVNADHEGRQPEADLPVLLVEPDHPAPHHFEQLLADFRDR